MRGEGREGGKGRQERGREWANKVPLSDNLVYR